MKVNDEIDEIKKRRKTRLSNFELWWQEKGFHNELKILGFQEAQVNCIKEYMRRSHNKGAESGIDWYTKVFGK